MTISEIKKMANTSDDKACFIYANFKGVSGSVVTQYDIIKCDKYLRNLYHSNLRQIIAIITYVKYSIVCIKKMSSTKIIG